MKASKFSEAQMAFVLKHAEVGTPIGEVRREARISDARFLNGRKKDEGIMPSEMKRLRQEENVKLKGIVTVLSLDKGMLQDVLSKKHRGLPASVSLSPRSGRTGSLRSAALQIKHPEDEKLPLEIPRSVCWRREQASNCHARPIQLILSPVSYIS